MDIHKHRYVVIIYVSLLVVDKGSETAFKSLTVYFTRIIAVHSFFLSNQQFGILGDNCITVTHISIYVS